VTVVRRSCLPGDSLYRGYESHTFTDITSYFLGKAHGNFHRHKDMKYATFDMRNPAREQGFDSDFDLVIASHTNFRFYSWMSAAH
jgi:hypothetical protein